MAKLKNHHATEYTQPATAPQSKWATTHGMYIGGRAYADEADMTAAEMEAKWGADRLRRLVPIDLREKFDRQRYLYNQAIWHGDLEDVRRESQRMVKAWLALDKVATAAGAAKLDPHVWEIALSNGSVACIVPDNDHANAVIAEGRACNVYTLDEIARLLETFPAIAAIKAQWPGAAVAKVKRNVGDPLDGIHDTSVALDEVIPF